MVAVRSSRQMTRWLVGISAMLLAFMLAPAGAAHAADSPSIPNPGNNLSDTGNGAITAADKDFVIRVRLAGLWEIPASNMAQEKSDNPKIVAIGKSIAAQHVTLDKLDVDVAKKLQIELPNVPNSDQLGWLGEMKNANATTFDQIYVDRLRAAHGKIFPAIATIRASTRNDSVRKLAQEANQFVMTHMTLLESSDIVDYGALPQAPAPATPGGKGPGGVPVDTSMITAAQTNKGLPGTSTALVLLVLAGAVVAGAITTMRILRAR